MSNPEPVFTVAAEVFARFPNFVVGCVHARGVDNRRAAPRVEQLLTEAESAVATAFATADPKEHPAIAPWRAAFGANGWTPSKFPASVEAIVKRVAKGNPLPRVNPLVDLGNAVVLSCLVPVGAHDVAQLAGPLTVRESCPGDVFAPLGDAPDESPDAGEIVYASGSMVRTRRWVWRQARNALITPDTRDVFFPVDGFAGATYDRVAAAVELLANVCREAFDADVRTGTVDAGHPTF